MAPSSSTAMMFNDRKGLVFLLDFLRAHHYRGKSLMLNDRIQSLDALKSALLKAQEYLHTLLPSTPYSEFEQKLQEIGLDRGWGNNAQRSLDMINLLLDLINAPDPCSLEKFLSEIPLVFNLVIISPHGYFAQENVLGYPDTGGQVTRLLPDVAGTTCGQRLERVDGTQNSDIIRVPFRTEKGIVRRWISRFEVWPYLENFAEDVANELSKELQTKPDLIIGNYSDGNMVALLLANKLGVTMCTIAHALEKTKYPNSDMYWKKFEEKYLFSCQFTADLIAMNYTDFIITSSFQEIAGLNNGELYRYIADTKGAFVQPAIYEAFGLTVVEAMTSGLPTCNGGPAEIIVHGKSGFHIDPYQGDKATELIVDFFEKCKVDPTHWELISKGGLERIQEKWNQFLLLWRNRL